jgi:hypothetical protein
LPFQADERVEYFFVPVLLVSVFAYFIAHCFLSIYEMTVDALLLCFCEAEKRKETELELNASMTVSGMEGKSTVYQDWLSSEISIVALRLRSGPFMLHDTS